MTHPLKQLVDFYHPDTRGVDHAGRTLDEILNWSDDQLEQSHDYIQVLFPLPEPSDSSAPELNEDVIIYFRGDVQLREQVRRVLKRMLAFYGFDIAWHQEGPALEVEVTPLSENEQVFHRWLKYQDHNHLRISRIIRSLRVLGLSREAAAVHRAFVRINQSMGLVVSVTTVLYWFFRSADPLSRGLGGEPIEWLRKFD
ncbi:opioid growth factor receptor conserved domain-containing protein [Durotheca rogersii]|uniref:opioid growth factor receptor conserved domain-containing protein n=1 Tax=Durotheca rogersii TaxID=419775 RepID=UPI00221FB33E|nr:opioid growth factor receptor conserved domain-containing protein [Durotheca rogersii]KAI5864044.1 opioid growth factor receptor conserved domain-containing protein [Durotheca rogersii]